MIQKIVVGRQFVAGRKEREPQGFFFLTEQGNERPVDLPLSIRPGPTEYNFYL